MASRDDPAQLLELADSLIDSEPHRAIELAEAMLGKTIDPELAIIAHRVAGLAARDLHRLDVSTEHFETAATLAERQGDTTMAGLLLLSVAGNHGLAGTLDRGFSLLDQAEKLLGGYERVLARFQRGTLHMFRDELDRAIEMFTEVLPLIEARPDPARRALTLGNLGSALMQVGRLVEARAALEAAHTANLKLGLRRPDTDVLHNLGLTAAWAGMIPRALEYFAEAEVEGKALGIEDPVGALDRARALLDANLLDEAAEAAQAAIAGVELSGFGLWLPEAHLALAEAWRRAGRKAEARAHALQAAGFFSQQARPPGVALAEKLGLLCAADLADRLPEALAVADRLDKHRLPGEAAELRIEAARSALVAGDAAGARLAAGAMGADDDLLPSGTRIRLLHGLAMREFLDGRPEAAAAALARGFDLLDTYRMSLGASELRANASSLGTGMASLGIRMALTDGSPLRLFDWTERLRASGLLAPPAHHPARVTASLDLLRARTRMVERTVLAGGMGDWQEVRRLEREVLILLRTVPGLDPADQNRIDPAVIVTATGADLISFFELEDRLGAVHISPSGARVVELGPARAVENRLDLLLFSWHRWIRHSLADPHGPARQTAYQAVDSDLTDLARLLLDPLEIQGESVILIPTGPLHRIPWRALEPLQDRRVIVSPTAGLWRRDRPADDGLSMVAVAGPDLAYADQEVTAVAARYARSVVLAGEQATCQATLRAVAGASIWHVAAHGLIRTDNPMFSAIRLADGPVTVFDLEELAPPPRTVVLAACEAAHSTVRPGDELLGLTAALLGIGVETVIAPVLPIADRASVEVMTRLHSQLAAGVPPAEALARTAWELTPGSDARRLTDSLVCFGRG